jgi:hypothetical protein
MIDIIVAAALSSLVGGSPAEDFTVCMRTHGVPGFPDAMITPDGRLLLAAGGASIDPFDAGYRAALATCADELPAGVDLPEEPEPPRPPEVPAPADPLPPTPPAPR